MEMHNVLGLVQPCRRECKDRKIGCHSECEKYLLFKEQLEKIRLKENERIINKLR